MTEQLLKSESEHPDTTAFLSARVPARLKNRFKALAAGRGAKVQNLLQQIVREYVEREDKAPVLATDVIAHLRAAETQLKGQGIAHLYLFGSVARGEAGPDSDIDLSYEPGKGKQLSLFDIGRLKQAVEDILDQPDRIDLAPRMRLSAKVRKTASADEIRIF
ncbi:MAG: nucleotidyltransferase domain-containing protein [Hyphomicrobiales bacterium]